MHRSRRISPAIRKKTAPSRNPTIAGDRPPRYGEKTVSCNDRGGEAPRYDEKTAPSPIQRSRGTGPRATVKKTVSCTDRGGEAPRYDEKTAPSPLHQSRGTGPRATVKRHVRGGQAPALRQQNAPPLTVVRGPVPRHATIAAERPRATRNNREPLDIYIYIWYPIDIWKMQSQRIPQH